MKRFQSLLLALALIGLASNTLLPAAQHRFGGLSGAIKDQSGANVVSATVSVRNNVTGETRTTISGGSFEITDLPPGSYTVTVEASGFVKNEATDVIISGGRFNRVDFTLQSVQSAETVSVPEKITTQPTQGQQVGKIGGTVMDRVQEDGDRSVLINFESVVPITEVGWRLSKDLFGVVKAGHTPEGWESKYDEKTSRLTISRGPEGLPLFEIKARYEFPKSWAAQLDEFFKKGGEFDFSLGDIRYGSRLFEVKKADPIKVVTPDQALVTPETARVGDLISATLNDGYKEDSLRVRVGEKSYDAYGVVPSDGTLHFLLANLLQSIGSPHEREQLEKVRKAVEENPTPERSQNQEPPLGKNGIIWELSADTPLDAKIHVTGRNKVGEKTFEGPVNLKILPALPPAFALAAPRLLDCTPKLFQGDKLCVCGFFPTLFSRQQLLLDGKRLNHPLSGLTDIVVFKPQNLAPGKHVITWEVPAFDSFFNPEPGRLKPSATERVEFVVLAARGSIDRDKLRSGQRTEMHLKILGTDEKLPIELTNETPDVIELEGGVKQVINTSGGSDNTLTRWVKAEKTGKPIADFNIRYRLTVPPCPCKPERISEFMPLSGVLTKPPERPSGDQTGEARQDCEQIMLEYTKLSIEYGKGQADLKKSLEHCNTFDDGTIAGRDLRDGCKAIVSAAFEVGVEGTGRGRLKKLREKMLALLARYRACRESKPAANQ
ncbi:MAG: carboxypeptidase-like regulatory domain-containing protein [Acidobacteriota bacterium]